MEIEKAKNAYDLDGKRVFLQIGSVCDRKNQKGAIELLKDLMQKNKSIYYVYAGGVIDENYQSEISQLAKNYGIEEQVKYLGEVSPGKELNEIYNLADAAIFPSKKEAFSLVIIESMSAGIPTITSSELRLVLDNVIRCNDAAKMKEILDKQSFGKSRKYLAEESRREIVEKYSWDKVAGDYLNSWESK